MADDNSPVRDEATQPTAGWEDSCLLIGIPGFGKTERLVARPDDVEENAHEATWLDPDNVDDF